MTKELTALYRPATWKNVIGQDAVVKSMRAVVSNRTNQKFLLIGPSGTGKTTVARIAAAEVGCEPSDIQEMDAATFTGVDDVRQITQAMRFRPLGGRARAIIINEVHRLSGNALDALLIPLEEPPEWIWWFLTTTNEQKVPRAIQTRCTRYLFKEVSKGDLRELLEDIASTEKIEMGADEREHDAIIDLCIKEANGSPRAAVNNLGACSATKSKAEAREVLFATSEVGGTAIDLARVLVKGTTWDQVHGILSSIDGEKETAEGIRKVIQNYVTKVIMGETRPKNPTRLFAILDQFSQPFVHGDGVTPLVLACGRLLLESD